MSEKKLSFGFNTKLLKRASILPIRQPEPPKSIQLIDCLEGQTIKIKDGVVEEKKLLVIPIQGDDKNLVERVIAAKALKQRSKKLNEEENEDNRPDSELSLDELAARQLIREAKSKLEAAPKIGATKVHVVPAVEDTLILEGSKQSTLDDYENVPIGDFGLAMLRGMGWSEKSSIGKDKTATSVAVPELRSKGMGLGAYKTIEEEVSKKIALDKDGKELSLVKGACAKIIAGKERGLYGKVEGLDDESGRIIVKMAIKGTTLSLNEFMLRPVTQEEYSSSSRILNNSKYREFQEKEAMSVNPGSSKKSISKSNTQEIKMLNVKTEKEGTRQRSRSQEINKNKEQKCRSYEKSSSKNYDKNIKKERSRSRSRSFDGREKKDRSYIKDRRSDKMEKSSKSSKYRSRSRSYDKYKRDDTKTRKSSKKHHYRKSRSSSFDSPPRSSNKYFRRSRSSSSLIDNTKKEKLISSKSKDRRSSSSSSKDYKHSSSKSKSKKSTRNSEKSKKYSETDYSSETDDEKDKYSKNKKVNKHKKDKKKSSKKYDGDEKNKSRSKKKNVSSESESSN